MTDKTQWPQMELPLSIGAPLAKLPIGRHRKLRMKGWDEGGHKKKGKGKKDGKEANVGEGENDTAPTDAKGKKMVRGPMPCRRCGEKGHRQAIVLSVHSVGLQRRGNNLFTSSRNLNENVNINLFDHL